MNPLVSVIVVAYNSSKTIEETLDSIRDQTYSPLELIISDDASPDNTVGICKAWLEKNKSRFVRAELALAKKNGGIPANMNRGIALAKGTYLKSIAADDILLPNCISDNVEFAKAHPGAKLIFSQIREFSVSSTGEKNLSKDVIPPSALPFFALSAEEQHLELLDECCLNAPSGFFDSALLKEFPYNENYPAMEDWPKWYALTKLGEKIYFLEKPTVLYRVGDSVSAANAQTFYSPRFMDSRKLFYLMELRAELIQLGKSKLKARYDREFLRYDLMMALFNNRKTAWSSFCRHIISRFLKIFVR